MRTIVFGVLVAALLGWTAMRAEGQGKGEGAYPVPWPALSPERAEAIEAKFLAAGGETYVGQVARHCERIANVQQVALLEKGDEGLETRADASAVKAVLDYVTKNAEALGFNADAVEARPVWVPGWGAAVGLVWKPGACESYSLGRFLALDAVARVAGEPAAVASLSVYTFPLPATIALPAARIQPDEAKAKLVGQAASVAKPQEKAPESVTVAAGNLGESRERIQAKPIAPDHFGFRKVFEIDFHSGPAASSPIVGHWFVDAVTGEVVGQDMVPPALAK